jgi:CDP-diacylglycerol--glycerol-3-phosphate 3-phosphatidyltransferase
MKSGRFAVLTLPNILTLLRLLSAPVFLALFFGLGEVCSPRDQWIRLLVCLGLVILSEVSDALDGYFARKYKQVSDFGKLMDPYADSAFRLTVLFSFAGSSHKWVPLWMVVVLLYRDILTSVVRTFAMKRGVVVAARVSGKLKAISQAAAIISVLVIAAVQELSARFESVSEALGGVGISGGSPQSVSSSAFWIMCVVVLIAVWSGVDYVWACRRHIVAAAEAGGGEAAGEAGPDSGD